LLYLFGLSVTIPDDDDDDEVEGDDKRKKLDSGDELPL
jgi:hypothetical protein